MHKYPKTYHVEGSDGRPAGGKVVALADIDCQVLIAEVKLDGSHFGMSAKPIRNEGHEWLLWHRNTVVNSDPEFSLLLRQTVLSSYEHFAKWAGVLTGRYEIHGEWCYARHTIPYTEIPCYAFHTDIYDREEERWISTPFRRQMLSQVCNEDFQPVPVVGSWKPEQYKKKGFDKELLRLVEQMPEEYLFGAPECEGLFLKAEQGGETVGFYKFIRPGFVRSVVESEHWKNRPLTLNGRRSAQPE